MLILSYFTYYVRGHTRLLVWGRRRRRPGVRDATLRVRQTCAHPDTSFPRNEGGTWSVADTCDATYGLCVVERRGIALVAPSRPGTRHMYLHVTGGIRTGPRLGNLSRLEFGCDFPRSTDEVPSGSRHSGREWVPLRRNSFGKRILSHVSKDPTFVPSRRSTES